MKKLILLLALTISTLISLAQAKQVLTEPGINSRTKIIVTSEEINTLDNISGNVQGQLNNKVDSSSLINFQDYFGVDSLIYNTTRKRWQYLGADNFWRTIAISDSAVVQNWSGLKTGMTSAWEFDEPSGTTATAAVGTLAGSAVGGVTVNQTGKIGKCWVLDNVNGYINFASDALIDLTNNWSISIWFKATDYSTNRYIFTKGTGVYAVRVNSTGPQLRVLTTALTPTAANATTFTPTANAWTHLVLTYQNGVGMKVYWNGVYKETLAMSGTLATDAFSLKIGRYTGTEIFNGSIDQFIIWKNRVLTASDVTILNNSNNGRPTNQM